MKRKTRPQGHTGKRGTYPWITRRNLSGCTGSGRERSRWWPPCPPTTVSTGSFAVKPCKSIRFTAKLSSAARCSTEANHSFLLTTVLPQNTIDRWAWPLSNLEKSSFCIKSPSLLQFYSNSTAVSTILILHPNFSSRIQIASSMETSFGRTQTTPQFRSSVSSTCMENASLCGR